MPCCEISKYIQAKVQKYGYELNVESRTFKDLVVINDRLSSKKMERRADVFAAQLVGANNFAIALKTHHSILDKYRPVEKNTRGSLEHDDHDTLEQRIALLDLYESGILCLNLKTGKIELNYDKKSISAKELKAMIEEREQKLLANPFTVIKKTYRPHKRFYIAQEPETASRLERLAGLHC